MATSSKYGNYSIHDEWQPHKTLPYLFKKVRKLRTVIGEFRKDKGTNEVSYHSFRNQEQIVHALDDGWLFATDLIATFRSYAVKRIIVETDTGNTYSITIDKFHEVKEVVQFGNGARRWGVRGPCWDKQNDDDGGEVEAAMKIGRFAK